MKTKTCIIAILLAGGLSKQQLPRTQTMWIKRGVLLIPLALGCFALSPAARAVDPPPDGGYPGNNTAEGEDALFSLTTSTDNTAIGFHALYSNTTGGVYDGHNTAVGSSALYSNTTGYYNTATGNLALSLNTTGVYNTANGAFALLSNTTGFDNTAVGYSALYSNTTGLLNTAIGQIALFSNTTGQWNTAIGNGALETNTTGIGNTANGSYSLFRSTTSDFNTAIGYHALYSNTTGAVYDGHNTAVGNAALFGNTTGSYNTAEGNYALRNNTTGSFNIALGDLAGSRLTTGDNNIDIGNRGVPDEANTIRIGGIATHKNTFIAGISGVTVAGGVGVIVDTNGHLGTVVSSARFKDAIKPMDKASEAILALKPVIFRYKHELDPTGIPQFGLVAEQVEKVNPDLVARDDQGKPYTVRYEAVNAMLLNEFLKQHAKVQEQEAMIAQQRKDFQATIAKLEATIAQQQKGMEVLAASLKEQAWQIDKVNEHLELKKAAPQIVANDQ